MASDEQISTQKKPDEKHYAAWLSERFSVRIDRERNRYRRESESIARAARDSGAWAGYLARKYAIADAYKARTTYPLFVTDVPESLQIKSWESFFQKTYRLNVLSNKNWPDSPTGGWYTPDNWLERINDIARTTIVVKYLDGVRTITEELEALSRDSGIADFHSKLEARDEGYYAAHVAIGIDFNLVKNEWDERKAHGQFEIQVTTQLQEVIRQLTHVEYETRRLRAAPPDVKWQWDYEGPAFKPNYLGHILHYLEGMIMEVRDGGDRV